MAGPEIRPFAGSYGPAGPAVSGGVRGRYGRRLHRPGDSAPRIASTTGRKGAGFVRSRREIVTQHDEATGWNRHAEYPSLLVGPDIARLAIAIPDPKMHGVARLPGNVDAFVANNDDRRRNRSSSQWN